MKHQGPQASRILGACGPSLLLFGVQCDIILNVDELLDKYPVLKSWHDFKRNLVGGSGGSDLLVLLFLKITTLTFL